MTSENRRKVVYFTYIDPQGKVKADRAEVNSNVDGDTLEMDEIEVWEAMLMTFHPGCTDLIIMFMENK